jgi:hypothetical protein
MKKSVVWIIVAVVLALLVLAFAFPGFVSGVKGVFGVSSGVSLSPPPIGCSETDGHLSLEESYYVKGSITMRMSNGISMGTAHDKCVDANTLTEYYCESKWSVKTYTETCSGGCVDGACVADEIACFKNSDCGEDTTTTECSADGTQSCTSSTTYICNNPGSTESSCSGAGSGSCGPCSDGCNPSTGLCNPSGTEKELIKIRYVGDDKMTINVTDNRGFTKLVYWANAQTGETILADSGRDRIVVVEMQPVNKSMYVVVGNENEGRLLEVTRITNSSSGFDSDVVRFRDVFSGDFYEVSITSEGKGTVSIAGNLYTVYYYASPNPLPERKRYVRIDYPDSLSVNETIVYPTIQTSLGANLAFYEPQTLNSTNWDGRGNALVTLKFPDGDKYTDVFVPSISGTQEVQVGELTYELTKVSYAGLLNIFLKSRNGSVVDPAITIFEEKDDNSEYHALILPLEGDGDDANGLGIFQNQFTATSGFLVEEQNGDVYKYVDYWGTEVYLNAKDSDQLIADIYYPDEQISI